MPPALARGAVQGTNRFASSLACEQGGQVGPPAPLKLPYGSQDAGFPQVRAMRADCRPFWLDGNRVERREGG